MYTDRKLTQKEFKVQKERMRKVTHAISRGLNKKGFEVVNSSSNVWKGKVTIMDNDPNVDIDRFELEFYFDSRNRLIFVDGVRDIPGDVEIFESIVSDESFIKFNIDGYALKVPSFDEENNRPSAFYLGVGSSPDDEDDNANKSDPEDESVEDMNDLTPAKVKGDSQSNHSSERKYIVKMRRKIRNPSTPEDSITRVKTKIKEEESQRN
ncbi:MAG: hypothetical protein IH596_07130 [Bacteroidales bacterium]|nr:hypothetical protein [Bacteroidales bacterium]